MPRTTFKDDTRQSVTAYALDTQDMGEQLVGTSTCGEIRRQRRTGVVSSGQSVRQCQPPSV
jgi:hypothetical protein